MVAKTLIPKINVDVANSTSNWKKINLSQVLSSVRVLATSVLCYHIIPGEIYICPEIQIFATIVLKCDLETWANVVVYY